MGTRVSDGETEGLKVLQSRTTGQLDLKPLCGPEALPYHRAASSVTCVTK